VGRSRAVRPFTGRPEPARICSRSDRSGQEHSHFQHGRAGHPTLAGAVWHEPPGNRKQNPALARKCLAFAASAAAIPAAIVPIILILLILLVLLPSLTVLILIVLVLLLGVAA
jgi:hypothetical protein